MPEVSPDPEKNRRSRSFGSFVLVLLVLLVVLAIVGPQSFQPEDNLSQDLYEWNLNTGKIVSQSFRGNENGTTLIEGKYRKKDTPGERGFRVHFSTLEGREAQFQNLKGVGTYYPVAPEVLAEAVANGECEPGDVRSLTAHWRPVPQKPAEGTDEEADSAESATPVVTEAAEVRREERLLVRAIVKSDTSRTGSFARLDMPEEAGTYYFDVRIRKNTDIAALHASLTSGGAPLHVQNFDLSLQNGGTFWKDGTSPLSWALFVLGPWVLLFVVFMVLMRQMRSQGGAGGVMSFGRSRAQLYSKENQTNVTFDDVAGNEEAKAEVREVVEFLKNPTRFTRIGGRIPRGVLLVGSPGCGKTLLAKAIAGEAEVPFFSISGSDFVEMFVGVGASRVRDLFKQARDNSPCIIFLDEIDAVGRRRGSGMGGGHDEREQTLNAILVEMDGFGTEEGIIVVAATNRPDVLDPALLRPGRFDREVTIDLPDRAGREAILGVHIKRVKASEEVDLGVLARSTPGYSGADLAAVINEAAIMAVLAKRDEINMEDLEESRDKVRYGRQKKSAKMEEDDRKITAYHEAGHAVIAAMLDEADSPHKVTIVPRGRALGATMVLPEKESFHMQTRKLRAQLTMLFGGRVAEAIFCGDVSAGASDDIRRATDLARTMVAELGMSETVGPINYAERQGSDFLGTELMRGKQHSEQTAQVIDSEVASLLRECYARAEELLSSKKAEVEVFAQALLAYETITGEEINRMLDGVSVEDLRPEPSVAETPPVTEASGESNSHGKDRGERKSDEFPGTAGLSPA